MMILTVCAACRGDDPARTNEAAASNEIALETHNQQLEAAEPGEPGGLPDDRNLVDEGPIEPNSGQGAGQVLQSYAALIEQGRWAEARRHWVQGGEDSGVSADAFEEAFGKYSEIHAEIGAPGPVEGAAGSVYVKIPLRFYGKLKSGEPFNSIGSATLRRVNDVPGSTAQQRRWHIYRIDVQPPL
jgi:hypothetical protein